jgi:uncharacterized membrane protein
VQLLVIGFDEPEFKGEIREELERLRDSDIVRLIDAIVVRKDENGNIEKVHVSDLTTEQAEEFGATVGALIGLGFGGDEESMEAGAVLGAAAGEQGEFLDENVWYVDDAIPNNSAAAVALLEHRWAIPLRGAIGRAGGFHLADAWVHPRDLVAIGLLAAEEASVDAAV